MKTSNKPNGLIKEKSPYLLQHAYNPVDWFPWGEEAFEKARKEDKPMFLSIGYSTCYWCHVMEREVFENKEIAKLMNEKLVCIKVDREEQPDVDRIYMSSVQAMTGSGGWPLSVFLTHDLKPFFGGTYFPPTSHYGKPGFRQVVQRISDLWKSEKKNIVESSNSITEYLTSQKQNTHNSPLTTHLLTKAFEQFHQEFDPNHAGFGRAPKFPRPSIFNFLLRYYHQTKKNDAMDMSLQTLRKMAEGGMYDQLGGGFHRYSVDDQWRIPHFEKMLYDQAQLACSYLEAFQITQGKFFADVARNVLDYVLRVMTSPEGGFYSAEDAESAFTHEHPEEKEEGTCYLWTKEELEQVLGNNAKLFCFHFGIEEQGNALSDPMRVFQKKNVLYVKYPIEETAKQFNLTVDEVEQTIASCKKLLFEKRELRPRPHLDDKVITAWNGLMISAFARAYQILKEEKYLSAALKATRFITKSLYNKEAKALHRRYRDGEARFNGSLQDYAFLIQGLIDLYETSFDVHWLTTAINLTKQQIRLFWDETDGGFFDSQSNDSTLLVRMKEDYDGAEPTGNSITVLNLLRLAHITSNNDWKLKAEQTLNLFGSSLSTHPHVLPQMLVALDWMLSTPKEIILVGTTNSEETQLLLNEIHSRYIPYKVLLIVDEKNRPSLEKILPFIKDMHPIDGKATAYICKNFACQLPTSDISVVREQLSK